MASIDSCRQVFSVPEDTAYFNAAYCGPQLVCSTDAMVAASRLKETPWNRLPSHFFEAADRLRVLASETLGGDALGYAITPSATYGATTAAHVLGSHLGVNDRVLTIAGDFPCTRLPWEPVAAKVGARIDSIQEPRDRCPTDALIEEILRGCRVVSMSTVRWTDGEAYDLLSISRACKAAGAYLVLDATQSLGAIPFDFLAVDPDFLYCAGYKWLLCPYGFGLLYVSERWRNEPPLEESWLARAFSENFANLVSPSANYREGAARFDVSETCAEAILSGAVVAIEQLKAWGIFAIKDRLKEINEDIYSALNDVILPGTLWNRSDHMFGVEVCVESSDLASYLAQQKIYVSVRGSRLRISPHLHVDRRDIEKLCNAIVGRVAAL